MRIEIRISKLSVPESQSKQWTEALRRALTTDVSVRTARDPQKLASLLKRAVERSKRP